MGSDLKTSRMDHEDLYELGLSRLDEFRRSGKPEDIQEAIEYLSHAREATPNGHPRLLYRHSNLGVAYSNRYQRLGQVNDLERGIKHVACALALTPNGHPLLPQQHASLGVSYENRYQRLNQLDDLKKSTEYFTRALALTPDGHPDLPARHANLGVSYGRRYQRLGQIEDLEKATKHSSRALALTPDGHPDLPGQHANLGVSYGDRFRRLGQLEDLNKSIEHKSRALELTPNGHPSLPYRHASLGVAFNDRYRRLGQLDDLERAIEHDSRALALTPHNHPDLPERHAALGVSYEDRYRRLAEVYDLDKSTEHKSRALALTSDGHPSLPYRHANLGASYNHRYEHLGQVEDLDKSTEHLSRALVLTPDNHPDLPDRHADLGGSYIDRYRHQGKLEDLNKAMEHSSRALALTPHGHPSLSEWHSALGVSYGDRYKHFGQAKDLEKAIKHGSRAIQLTPEGHPGMPRRHCNQALLLRLHYLHTGDPFSLTHALFAFRSASQIPTGSPRLRFEHALLWAKLASEQISLNPIEAYRTTIDLLPQYIWLGSTTHQRYQDLAATENLAINAATAAISGSDHKLALEWLEHARCVVWNQSLILRSPIVDLHSSHPDLATRLQSIAKQLNEAGSVSSASHTPLTGSDDWEQIGNQRRRLVKEYEDLLVKARTLPGFKDFFRPMKADRLVRAAKRGPIAVINCHQDRCDALLVLPGHDHVQHLPLPNFTHGKAKAAQLQLETSLRNKGVRERGVKVRQKLGDNDIIASVLRTLWQHVVEPVLKFLGCLDKDPARSLPYITWCPTGALSFLPLHAAGDYDQPGSRVFDYAISSYTPTLTSLLAPVPSPSNPTPRVLAIGQEHTPGHSPLPGTAKELASLQARASSTAHYSELTNNQATTADVLDAMEKHDWVHLACHAHQNVRDPTKSGFFLHDGTLDLAKINQRSFKNKGLAFLSACQTAAGDEKLPDEAVHLASGMLMAGYPSVIATMWSVKDADAPVVADGVYAELIKDGRVGNGEAGRALHNAVAALRDKVGEKEFTRWVPYIHIGS